MPDPFVDSAGCDCCRSVEIVPPLRAPLAIHARGHDGFSTWMTGTFDGRCWWSPELPAGAGYWVVVGWRALEDHAEERTRPCARRARQGGPRVFRGSGGATLFPAALAPAPAHASGQHA